MKLHPSQDASVLPQGDLEPTLIRQVRAVIDGEPDRIANLANVAALLFMETPAVNWVGFYLLDHDELVLGPFQGKPACTRIPLGSGVCGTAAVKQQTVRVPDVHAFDGHIACDVNSRSELVIPLMSNQQVVGVLDIDSPELDRFTLDDQQLFEAVARIVERAC